MLRDHQRGHNVGVVVTVDAPGGEPPGVHGGEDVAEVRDVVYSSEAGTLLGFTLNKRGFLRGKMRDVLAADDVAAIGADAVMIDDDDCRQADADDLRARSGVV